MPTFRPFIKSPIIVVIFFILFILIWISGLTHIVAGPKSIHPNGYQAEYLDYLTQMGFADDAVTIERNLNDPQLSLSELQKKVLRSNRELLVVHRPLRKIVSRYMSQMIEKIDSEPSQDIKREIYLRVAKLIAQLLSFKPLPIRDEIPLKLQREALSSAENDQEFIDTVIVNIEDKIKQSTAHLLSLILSSLYSNLEIEKALLKDEVFYLANGPQEPPSSQLESIAQDAKYYTQVLADYLLSIYNRPQINPALLGQAFSLAFLHFSYLSGNDLSEEIDSTCKLYGIRLENYVTNRMEIADQNYALHSFQLETGDFVGIHESKGDLLTYLESSAIVPSGRGGWMGLFDLRTNDPKAPQGILGKLAYGKKINKPTNNQSWIAPLIPDEADIFHRYTLGKLTAKDRIKMKIADIMESKTNGFTSLGLVEVLKDQKAHLQRVLVWSHLPNGQGGGVHPYDFSFFVRPGIVNRFYVARYDSHLFFKLNKHDDYHTFIPVRKSLRVRLNSLGTIPSLPSHYALDYEWPMAISTDEFLAQKSLGLRDEKLWHQWASASAIKQLKNFMLRFGLGYMNGLYNFAEMADSASAIGLAFHTMGIRLSERGSHFRFSSRMQQWVGSLPQAKQRFSYRPYSAAEPLASGLDDGSVISILSPQYSPTGNLYEQFGAEVSQDIETYQAVLSYVRGATEAIAPTAGQLKGRIEQTRLFIQKMSYPEAFNSIVTDWTQWFFPTRPAHPGEPAPKPKDQPIQRSLRLISPAAQSSQSSWYEFLDRLGFEDFSAVATNTLNDPDKVSRLYSPLSKKALEKTVTRYQMLSAARELAVFLARRLEKQAESPQASSEVYRRWASLAGRLMMLQPTNPTLIVPPSVRSIPKEYSSKAQLLLDHYDSYLRLSMEEQRISITSDFIQTLYGEQVAVQALSQNNSELIHQLRSDAEWISRQVGKYIEQMWLDPQIGKSRFLGRMISLCLLRHLKTHGADYWRGYELLRTQLEKSDIDIRNVEGDQMAVGTIDGQRVIQLEPMMLFLNRSRLLSSQMVAAGVDPGNTKKAKRNQLVGYPHPFFVLPSRIEKGTNLTYRLFHDLSQQKTFINQGYSHVGAIHVNTDPETGLKAVHFSHNFPDPDHQGIGAYVLADYWQVFNVQEYNKFAVVPFDKEKLFKLLTSDPRIWRPNDPVERAFQVEIDNEGNYLPRDPDDLKQRRDWPYVLSSTEYLQMKNQPNAEEFYRVFANHLDRRLRQFVHTEGIHYHWLSLDLKVADLLGAPYCSTGLLVAMKQILGDLPLITYPDKIAITTHIASWLFRLGLDTEATRNARATSHYYPLSGSGLANEVGSENVVHVFRKPRSFYELAQSATRTLLPLSIRLRDQLSYRLSYIFGDLLTRPLDSRDLDYHRQWTFDIIRQKLGDMKIPIQQVLNNSASEVESQQIRKQQVRLELESQLKQQIQAWAEYAR